MKTKHLILIILSTFTWLGLQAQTKMVFIKGGTFVPLYGTDSLPVKINDLYMDVYPVTNMQYLAFVKQHQKWQKNKVLRIFADQNYLMGWLNDTTLANNMNRMSPVTNISWYAAKAYCDCLDKRLPTVDEWEYVGMANDSIPDARLLKNYNTYILAWYEKPRSYKNTIGSTFKNYYGVYDMHGLVWEWTSDFNSILISGESRKDVDNDKNLFCGSGAVGANDLMDYAAFMRYALRGSLKANYAMRNLGFRCVSDVK
ncbi:formylglycine-generating enzyme family protein [Putridiphycobacter roseus]|uniref:Formylglycine-generating enzyme family protein n=1 Tax=Putridiphycobacter roseus TaxID=2219161 RepID=A0A2W1NR09_9FLAO|nr:formylglycine-generating enzyme family protein [Putridiphycobacter roseus]PZE18092.1 formylglycine-generating enzyme family protein [Putridiphycobacter roseus]